MENLRWILIFAGVAILVLLWISGRSARRDAGASDTPDPLLGDDPLGAGFGDFHDFDPDDLARPGEPSGGAASPLAPSLAPVERSWAPESATGPLERGGAFALANAHPPTAARASAAPEPTGFGALTRKFERFGEKLAPGRGRREVAPDPAGLDEEHSAPPFASKIVTLHVVAPAGDILPPEALRDVLERRGYHHGDMNIYHSLYQGRTVFSIARMVKPGTFDLDDPSTFETPGLAFILQLPGPVAADTAFEVMLEEAFEIADELGGGVLDGNRSTLGRQTRQHLREEIHQYMHRQKYFESVA